MLSQPHPKISIVMPVLNREDTLEKAINSILDQGYENLEIIIMDGGSTDKTVEIIRKYEKHLAYWCSKPDGSAALATNIGIQKATGDVIGLCMADDWYEPNTFAKVAAAYQANDAIDIFTCAGRIVAYNDKMKAYQPLLTYSSQRELALTFYNICYATSAICTRFIRKRLYDRIGLFVPFDPEGKQFLANDKEFLLRAMLSGAQDLYIHHLGHTYLAHRESFSFGNQRTSNVKHCREHMDIAKSLLKQAGLTKRSKAFLHYWYIDQSVRLVLYKLIDLDIKAAWITMKKALRSYHLVWPVVFLITLGQITGKRSLKWLRSTMGR